MPSKVWIWPSQSADLEAHVLGYLLEFDDHPTNANVWRLDLKLLSALLAATLLLSVPLVARATTYDFTSLDFTVATGPFTTSDTVSGSVSFAGPLAANTDYGLLASQLTFSFSDGVDTISNANADPTTYFLLDTDSTGNIGSWQIRLDTTSPVETIQLEGCDSTQFAPTCVGISNVNDTVYVAGGGGYGGEFSSYGSGEFTLAAATPEPGSFVLLGTGILGFAAVLRRKAPAIVA